MKNQQVESNDLSIEVWVIGENLSRDPVLTVQVSSCFKISQLKLLICTRLGIDANRYELFCLEKYESSMILQEISGPETLELCRTAIMQSGKVCLKFEDINWDFSKNEDAAYNFAVNESLKIKTPDLISKIENTTKARRDCLKLRSIHTIKRNLKNIMASLKLD